MVQVRQSAIQPGLADANYGSLLQASMAGENLKLRASEQKMARIRASIAETKINNKTSADAQAAWLGAIETNPALLRALENSPPRIRKAYQKASQGRATLEDNSVIASYLGSVETGMANQRALEDRALNTRVKEANILQSNEAARASRASADLSAQRSALEFLEAQQAAQGGTSEAQQKMNLASAISGVPGGTSDMGASTQTVAPPASALNTSDTPVARPLGVVLPEPQPVPATPKAPEALTGNSLIDNNPFAPQGPVETTPEVAPVSPEVDPNAPVFRNSEGEIVTADPQVVSSAEVAALVQEKGVSPAQATQRLQAEAELAKAKQEYVYGEANVQNLPTFKEYVSRLVLADVDIDDANKMAAKAAELGQVYVPLTTEEERKRSLEFNDSWKSESAGFANLLQDTQNMHEAAQRIYDNLIEAPAGGVSGFTGKSQAFLGLDFIPDGASAVEVGKAISQLRSDSALNTIVELKKASRQGATGLGQVSVVEFTSLIEQGNTISQDLQNEQLREATERYIYERNKTAYNTYQSMVNRYGLSAVNSISGVSARQLGNILKDIETYETMTDQGKKTAARLGSYADRIEMPQRYKTTAQEPSPAQQKTIQEEEAAQALDQAEFSGRDMNRAVDRQFQSMSGTRIPGISNPFTSSAGNVLRFFNVMPDFTDEQYVNQRTEELMQNSIIKPRN